MDDEMSKNISWNERLEEYFCSTGEKSLCNSILHKKAETLYANRRNFIDLPSIVISSVVGFLSAGSTSIFGGETQTASYALGISSLLVSMLQTLGAYFKFSQKSEQHRIAAISYEKLYRFLSVEMSLQRSHRTSPSDLLKSVKQEVDRLQELSPLIPDTILKDFQRKYEKVEGISKPEIANGLEKIVPFRSVLSLENLPKNPSTFVQGNPMLSRDQTPSVIPKENHLKEEPTVNTTHEQHSLHIGLPISSPIDQ